MFQWEIICKLVNFIFNVIIFLRRKKKENEYHKFETRFKEIEKQLRSNGKFQKLQNKLVNMCPKFLF